MIESTANPTIKSVRKLHQQRHRKTQGQTLVEGPNGLEALRSSHTVPALILLTAEDEAALQYCEQAGLTPTLVSQRVLNSASDTKHAVGPIAVIPIPEDQKVRKHHTIALVDVGDPGNVGTIVRAAVGFDFDVAVYGATADPWSPKAIRAAAATTLTARIARGVSPVADCAVADLESIALVVRDGEPLGPATVESMIMVGSEAKGLDHELVGAVDRSVTIAIKGIESLNAASAASIAMYAATALS
ncbi:MAG: TrmH family RNA methyltransferase [Acidimicrobiia bacterium]